MLSQQSTLAVSGQSVDEKKCFECCFNPLPLTHTHPQDCRVFVWQRASSLCGAMESNSSHISVLIYTLSLAHASNSLRLIAVHSRPIKLQSNRVIQCLLCCQPSQRITGRVVSFLATGCSQTRRRKWKWRSCRRDSARSGHSMSQRCDQLVTLEEAQP